MCLEKWKLGAECKGASSSLLGKLRWSVDLTVWILVNPILPGRSKQKQSLSQGRNPDRYTEGNSRIQEGKGGQILSIVAYSRRLNASQCRVTDIHAKVRRTLPAWPSEFTFAMATRCSGQILHRHAPVTMATWHTCWLGMEEHRWSRETFVTSLFSSVSRVIRWEIYNHWT